MCLWLLLHNALKSSRSLHTSLYLAHQKLHWYVYMLKPCDSFFISKHNYIHISNLLVICVQPVHLTCVGEGPVVHVMPLEMDWGQVPVLEDCPKTVRLSNESLIPAKFTAHMQRPDSVWRVEPESAEIGPEEQLDLVVTACLNDCVRWELNMITIKFFLYPK